MKKRILGICGTQKKNGFSSSEFLLREALLAAESDGAETKMVKLTDYNILTCDGCGLCMANTHCHLLEDPKDELSQLYEECVKADGFIFSSPVYALSLPSIWKNWIDRCEPCTDDDLSYEYYCYDTVSGVKGKALKGKVAGQIVVAAGPGHEWAMASLMPAFTAVKLSVVVSVGLSLIEYDSQPGIRSQAWSRNLGEADYAINIARSVGKRVNEAVGYSTFKIDQQNRALVCHDQTKLNGFSLEDAKGQLVKLSGIKRKRAILIASNQYSADEGIKWLTELANRYNNKSDTAVYNLALVEKLPHFITKEFIREKVLSKVGLNNIDYLFDWDLAFANKYGLGDGKEPAIVVLDIDQGIITLARRLTDIDTSELFKQLDNIVKEKQ